LISVKNRRLSDLDEIAVLALPVIALEDSLWDRRQTHGVLCGLSAIETIWPNRWRVRIISWFLRVFAPRVK